jgi:hypothetical protein
MKPHWKRYATIALVALAASLLIRGVLQRRESEQEARKQKVFDELKRKVTDFAEKRGAVTDWQKELGGRGAGFGLYTADLQPKLVRADGRPIFFYGRVLDIETGPDGYVVRFRSKPRVLAEVDFSLTCRAEAAAELLKRRSESLNEYAVVAQIGDVRADQSHPREEGGKVFLATGRCIDVMATGEHGYSLSLLWGLSK